ncbi:LysR family transcriptional regulator [Microtetraspora sp. NBRC 16547]|uniref:LysR family transcriptional regulator n=1 Tax=Microtetraspora sp. NBRC 16547 TaxID=3030993 RepID=UPI002555CE51|nr:LysR family transcriptional regulator [Microtetraspora sp. NBRC 16547]
MFGTDALRLLDAVARTGSFTAAAAELNYTQSAVSRRIASLETAAGGPLFERLPRGVRLTPAGHALHRHALDVLERLESAAEELSAIHRGTGGRLRVGAFATANASLVPGALRAFMEGSPGVETAIVEGPSGRLMERLAYGSIDVAVVSDYPSALETGPESTLTPLMEDEFLVALPSGHPLAGNPVVQLRDLKDENWIEAPPRGHSTMLATSCARAGFTPRTGFRVAEWTGKFGYVAAGLGVTLVPAMAAEGVRGRTDLVLRPLGEFAPRRAVYAALPSTAPLPAALAFLRRLQDQARSGRVREGMCESTGGKG